MQARMDVASQEEMVASQGHRNRAVWKHRPREGRPDPQGVWGLPFWWGQAQTRESYNCTDCTGKTRKPQYCHWVLADGANSGI